ncbi:MAG: hypothetical protein WAK31_16560 [Chthoniobacterales bacterium]
MNRCDQQILDRLFDQPPPASAFETMSIGGVSKTAFHQMLPGVSDRVWLAWYWFVDALDPRGFDRDGV